MIFDKIKKIIIDVVNKIDVSKQKRYNLKYTNEYYVDMIFLLINKINSWPTLTDIKNYGFDRKIYKNHYKTIYNKFNKWTKEGVFKSIFDNIVLSSKQVTNNLIIDACAINNKYGSESISYNPENTKKKVTKISLLANFNGFIIDIQNFKFNKEKKDKNKNKKTYKTFCHDVKMIDSHLESNNFKSIKNKSKYLKIIGDKAYKHKKVKVNGKTIIIITPDKKNTKNKNKNNTHNNDKLKKRKKVEHIFLFLKRYERLIIRKDKKINMFMSWIYIVSSVHNLNF